MLISQINEPKAIVETTTCSRINSSLHPIYMCMYIYMFDMDRDIIGVHMRTTQIIYDNMYKYKRHDTLIHILYICCLYKHTLIYIYVLQKWVNFLVLLLKRFSSEIHFPTVTEVRLHPTYIWVNYHNSLTWILRPFGDDFPRINHDSRVREISEFVIIYPDIWYLTILSLGY